MDERIIEYARKWYELNGIKVPNTGDHYLEIEVNGFSVEVAWSDIRERALNFLESEADGVRNS